MYDDTSNEPVRIFDSGAVPDDPETFGEYRLTYRTGDIVSPRVEAAEPLGLEVLEHRLQQRLSDLQQASASDEEELYLHRNQSHKEKDDKNT